MVQETGVQSQVESYQRLKKWYLISPCLTLSIIRYIPSVKWSNPGKGVVSSPTSWCCSYWKGSLQVALNYGHQLYNFINIYIYIEREREREYISTLYAKYIFKMFTNWQHLKYCVVSSVFVSINEYLTTILVMIFSLIQIICIMDCKVFLSN